MAKTFSFVHLSDIHFGQEKGGDVEYNNDAKDQLLRDVARIAQARREAGRPPISGVLITGDIAYSGKESQYADAGAWLQKLTTAAGCDETAVLVVPGNHDVDRARITMGARLMINMIAAGGQTALDACLANEGDREVLYERFAEYRRFAYGYGCELSQEGGRAAERRIELAPGRILAFAGLNSALLCGEDDEEGKLLVGAKQHVFNEEDGVAHVVMSHHPLNWLSDQDKTRDYLLNRTCLLLSGHEHKPDAAVEEIDGRQRFLSLAAGATVPDVVTDDYNYTYNIIDFALAEEPDCLNITVQPRSWVKSKLRFEGDADRFGGEETRTYTVHCPCYRSDGAAKPSAAPAAAAEMSSERLSQEKTETMAPAADLRFAQLRLQFFRELDAIQRLRILADLGVLPKGVTSVPSLTVERMALEKLNDPAKVGALAEAIKSQLSAARKGG